MLEKKCFVSILVAVWTKTALASWCCMSLPKEATTKPQVKREEIRREEGSTPSTVDQRSPTRQPNIIELAKATQEMASILASQAKAFYTPAAPSQFEICGDTLQAIITTRLELEYRKIIVQITQPPEMEEGWKVKAMNLWQKVPLALEGASVSLSLDNSLWHKWRWYQFTSLVKEDPRAASLLTLPAPLDAVPLTEQEQTFIASLSYPQEKAIFLAFLATRGIYPPQEVQRLPLYLEGEHLRLKSMLPEETESTLATI